MLLEKTQTTCQAVRYSLKSSEGLKVDTEAHIVLPGCSTKRGTLDELRKEGQGIRFEE